MKKLRTTKYDVADHLRRASKLDAFGCRDISIHRPIDLRDAYGDVCVELAVIAYDQRTAVRADGAGQMSVYAEHHLEGSVARQRCSVADESAKLPFLNITGDILAVRRRFRYRVRSFAAV